MTRQEFLQVLKESKVSFHNKFSHIYGSDYYSFQNGFLRVSDHSKHEHSLGYDTYKVGVNDFRSYQDAYNHLHNFCNLNFAKEMDIFFKENRSKIVKELQPDGSFAYRNGLGGLFVTEDSALNNWFRLLNLN